MNQEQLVNLINAEYDVTKVEAERMLKAVGAIVQSVLSAGDDVSLPGIGRLSVKARAARNGHNPQTGASMVIPARNVVHLSVAKALKDVV